jgi:hypothetical protein
MFNLLCYYQSLDYDIKPYKIKLDAYLYHIWNYIKKF